MNTIDTSLKGLCEAVLQEYKNFDPQNYAGDLRSINGFTDAINSPQNRNGFEQAQITTSDNSIRKVRVRGLQRTLESEIIEDKAAFDCDPGDTKKWYEEEVDVTMFVGDKQTFKKSEMRTYCKNPQAFVQEVLMTSFGALAEKEDKKLLAKAYANKGVNIKNLVSDQPSSNCKVVEMINQFDQNLPGGWQTIKIDYRAHQFRGTPFIVGDADALQRFMMNLDIACCNDGGQDIAELARKMGILFFLDQSGDEIMGTDNNLLLAPGAIQHIEYLENEGVWGEVDGASMNGTIIDPMTGKKYDWDMLYDACDKVWVSKVSKYTDIYFSKVADSFKDGDPLKGVNGVWCYQTVRKA